MKKTVNDIIYILEKIAPSSLAQDWDNIGLQVGSLSMEVENILIALDPTLNVVESACKNGFQLLITHHPLIFKPIKSIRFNETLGNIISLAACHKLSIFAMHTNLDSVSGGINDILVNKIGLVNIKSLSKTKKTDNYKLVVYVPLEYEQQVLSAIFKNDFGKIGNYSCCTFRNTGKGSFKPGMSTDPFLGKKGEICHADEFRIEVIVAVKEIKKLIENIKKIHPYETIAYDIYPIVNIENEEGIGRVGYLSQGMSLINLAMYIKERLDISTVKISGKSDLFVKKVALCSGSGSGLMQDFFASGAQVFISGDFKYHEAREIEDKGLALLDIGHFNSEHLIVNYLADDLKLKLSEAGFDINISAYQDEKDPFIII